jgi:hypothetical protein
MLVRKFEYERGKDLEKEAKKAEKRMEKQDDLMQSLKNDMNLIEKNLENKID